MVCGSQLKKLKLKIQGLNWYPKLAIYYINHWNLGKIQVVC